MGIEAISQRMGHDEGGCWKRAESRNSQFGGTATHGDPSIPPDKRGLSVQETYFVSVFSEAVFNPSFCKY